MSRERAGLLLTLWAYGWDDEQWFVPLAKALEGVGAAEAAWQPAGGGNTIWQTVNHLNFYNERMLCRLTGTTAPAGPGSNTATFSEPGDPADAAGWQATLDRTRSIAEGMRAALARLSDADLDGPWPPSGKSTVGTELARWLMHDAYHTGQIVLLRKQQGSWPAERE